MHVVISHRKPVVPRWQQAFLTMMPAIEARARCVFRHLDSEAQQEAVQEVICNALCVFARLAELGKLDLAYPSVLAAYGIRQFYERRRVGNRLNIRDVSSEYCQRRKKITMERLDHFDQEENAWKEAVVEDPRTPVFDQVWFRCDFPVWLNKLSSRNRKIALKLVTNESTGRVARMFHVSAARISQLRKEFKRAWKSFHGEAEPLKQPPRPLSGAKGSNPRPSSAK